MITENDIICHICKHKLISGHHLINECIRNFETDLFNARKEIEELKDKIEAMKEDAWIEAAGEDI